MIHQKMTFKKVTHGNLLKRRIGNFEKRRVICFLTNHRACTIPNLKYRHFIQKLLQLNLRFLAMGCFKFDLFLSKIYDFLYGFPHDFVYVFMDRPSLSDGSLGQGLFKASLLGIYKIDTFLPFSRRFLPYLYTTLP